MNRCASGAPAASSSASLSRLCLEPVGIHDPSDQPDRQRFIGLNNPTGERQVARPSEADKPGQQPRPAEVEGQPPLDEDLGEPCSAARDHEVTTEGEVHPGADGDAIDGSNRRLRYPVERERCSVRVAHVLRVCRRCPESGEVGAEIGAGAEFATRPGDHQCPLF